MESSNTTEAKPVVRVERDPHTSTDGLALQSCDLQIVEFLVIKTCADYQFVYSLVPHDTPHTAESFRKEERNALAGFMDGVGNVDAFPSHATIGDRRRIPFYEIREKSGETRPVRGLISIQPIRRGLSIVVCMQKSPSGSANGCLNLIDPVLTKDPPQDVQTALVGTLATKRLEAALGSREKD